MKVAGQPIKVLVADDSKTGEDGGQTGSYPLSESFKR